MIAVNNLRSGEIFKENGQPYTVVKYSHVKMGRGNAVIKIKAKSLLNGAVLEKSFLSGAAVEEADVEKIKVQYLYKAGGLYFFMESRSYEQIDLPEDFLGDNVHFLKEGENYDIIKFEGSPVTLQLPITVILKVAETGSGFKGDTVSASFKPAVLETGLKTEVPLFINTDDFIKVDTRDGSYVERA